jgi:hypothetical protein
LRGFCGFGGDYRPKAVLIAAKASVIFAGSAAAASTPDFRVALTTLVNSDASIMALILVASKLAGSSSAMVSSAIAVAAVTASVVAAAVAVA